MKKGEKGCRVMRLTKTGNQLGRKPHFFLAAEKRDTWK